LKGNNRPIVIDETFIENKQKDKRNSFI